jgi:hypothetical protein
LRLVLVDCLAPSEPSEASVSTATSSLILRDSLSNALAATTALRISDRVCSALAEVYRRQRLLLTAASQY